MQNNESVIVDTSVWIAYLRGRNPASVQQLSDLIADHRAILCGIVLAEVLVGVRDAKERVSLDDMFRALPYLETSLATWTLAGELAYSLRSRGLATPLSDLILAAIALEHGFSLFTHDTHFQRISDLRLYQPA